MTLIEPPANVNFGFVTGRFALAVADTAQDVDHKPDFVAAAGTVSFRPASTKIVTGTPARFISPQTVTSTLNSAGVISDGNGVSGIWLIVGTYTVSFKLAGLTVSSFDVTVTAAHTDVAPLDLVLHTPAPIEPNVKFVVNEQVYTETLAARDEVVALLAGVEGGMGAGINDATTASTTTWSSSKINTSLTGKAATSHTHATSQVTGLDTALAGKSDTGHGHTTAQVTGLDTALSGKAAATHTHAQADVTGLTTALSGKADTTALASYVPTTRTIAGKALSGNVTLAKADVGLSNVDNTTDAAKPISTATQSALNGKLGSSNATVSDVIYVTTLPGTVVNGTLYLTPKA